MAVRRKLELIHGLVDALEAKVDAGMQEWYAAGRLLSSPPHPSAPLASTPLISSPLASPGKPDPTPIPTTQDAAGSGEDAPGGGGREPPLAWL